VILGTDAESGVTDRRALNPRTAQVADTRATSEFKRAWAAIFLGDWHPLLRDPLDLFRLSFLVGAVVFAVQGDWDAVVRLLIPCLLVFLIRALELPRPIDWVFCLAMAFQGWGNALHLFSQFWWYDNTVHITLPMSLAPILYIGLSRLDVVPEPAQRVHGRSELIGMALIAGCLGVTAASGYEIYEWAVDHWLGQHLFIGETDTVTDLADGFLGAGLGGLLLAVWALARYTSRRLPTRVARDMLITPPQVRPSSGGGRSEPDVADEHGGGEPAEHDRAARNGQRDRGPGGQARAEDGVGNGAQQRPDRHGGGEGARTHG
jgi:hypothetical protein